MTVTSAWTGMRSFQTARENPLRNKLVGSDRKLYYVKRDYSPYSRHLKTKRPTKYGRSQLQQMSFDEDGDEFFTNEFITSFKYGDKVQVEVVQFGPLGASVDVVGAGHSPDDIIPEDEPPLGTGLILQKEIRYFREARNNVDVVLGEVLLAYIEKNDRDDGKLGITLRTPGGRGKAQEVGRLVLEKLQQSKDGTISVGDKSSPEDISREFPGVSKSSFKRALSALYKKGLVKPGPKSTLLL